MRLPRRWWVGLRCIVPVFVAVAAGGLPAQQPDSVQSPADSALQQRAYEARRAALVKELRDAQQQLSQLRAQRVELEARIDNTLAQEMARRAQMLLMSTEQNALLQLDTTLATAQDNMQTQRDRMRALGDAVRRRSGAVLVVVLRADSTPAVLGGVELRIDNASAATRSYTPTAAQALQAGAVDELYRSEVLPTAHSVAVTVTLGGGGQPVTQSLAVSVPASAVTYVQFSVRNGQVVSRTWTSQGTAPF